MITVAIIGILASIAIPNFQMFVYQARAGEAKTNLAAIFVAEQSLMADEQQYTYCLYQGGFQPDVGAVRYYSVGFISATHCPGNCVSYDTGQTCSLTAIAWGPTTRDDATFNADSSADPTLLGSPPASTYDIPTVSTFTAAAWGSIAPTGVLDIWTIDQTNTIVHAQPGF